MIRALKPGQVRMCGRLTGFGVRKGARGQVRFFTRKVVGARDVRTTLGSYPELSVRAARALAAKQLSALATTGTSECHVPKPREVVPRSGAAPGHTGASEALAPAAQSLDPQSPPAHALPAPDITRTLARLLGSSPAAQSALKQLLKPGQGARSSPTLATFVETCCAPHWQTLAEQTRKHYFGIWHRYIAPTFGACQVHTITAEQIVPWTMRLAHIPRTANAARDLLLRALREAQRQGLLDKAPTLRVKRFRLNKREGLSEHQLARLVDHLNRLLVEKPSSHLWAVITILNTGERREACIKLHTSEVNFDQLVITRMRKGGRVEPLPMTNFTADFLRAIYPEGGGYFFPSKRSRTGHIDGHSLLTWFQRECTRLNILTREGRPPCLHSLRHTWASTLARSGVALPHIQKLLGHSSLQTTINYIQSDHEAARKAANVVTKTHIKIPFAQPTIARSLPELQQSPQSNVGIPQLPRSDGATIQAHQTDSRDISTKGFPGPTRTRQWPPRRNFTAADQSRGAHRARPVIGARLDATTARALITPVVQRLGRATMAQLRHATKISSRKLRSHVSLLVAKGVLTRHGHARGSYYVIAGA